MNEEAFVTIMSTENYLEGVLALFESLKLTKTKCANFVVVVNETISNKTISALKENGCKVEKRNRIIVPNEILKKNNFQITEHWNNTFDKFNIFELTSYKKIVYLDSDMYITQNIDELFILPNMSAVCAGQGVHKEWTKINSGIMVIEPQKGLINKFIKILNTVNFNKNIGDQDIIEHYFKWENNNELHLPQGYNMFAKYVDYYIKELGYSLEDIIVMHFTGLRKPWMMNDEEIKDFIDSCNKNGEKYKLEFFNRYINIIKHIRNYL